VPVERRTEAEVIQSLKDDLGLYTVVSQRDAAVKNTSTVRYEGRTYSIVSSILFWLLVKSDELR
jgi:hypothetical protein